MLWRRGFACRRACFFVVVYAHAMPRRVPQPKWLLFIGVLVPGSVWPSGTEACWTCGNRQFKTIRSDLHVCVCAGRARRACNIGECAGVRSDWCWQRNEWDMLVKYGPGFAVWSSASRGREFRTEVMYVRRSAVDLFNSHVELRIFENMFILTLKLRRLLIVRFFLGSKYCLAKWFVIFGYSGNHVVGIINNMYITYFLMIVIYHTCGLYMIDNFI